MTSTAVSTGSQAFHVVYRISDKGNRPNSSKIDNATKQHCLLNAIEHFGRDNIYVIADNCSDGLISFIDSQGLKHEETHLGNSASSKYAVTKIINTYQDDDIVYMLEDDYLHIQDSMQLIIEGLEIADYVTLYDHPDQYMTFDRNKPGAAPLNRFGLHSWKIFVTEHSHWRETPSTTMTFAAKVKTLKADYKIFMANPDKGIPLDFITFLKLTKQRGIVTAASVWKSPRALLAVVMNMFAPFRKKRLLISCIPGRSTHCEKQWLSPLTDWTKV